ncbi:MAG: hypothetical protein PHV42_02340 [Candidatus Pacebacteria bacterium]|nr:hypothetical protein [Candidatus Paceibacterota bacterium]
MKYSVVKSWLPFALIITGFCALVYGTVQQDYRQSLNDPQIQMAEDASAKLESGASPQLVVPTEVINISSSLAPYTIVYGDDGKEVAFSGRLDGNAIIPPLGVFDFAKQNGEDRLTFEPQAGVRSAVVVRYYNNAGHSGFVLVGRGMREVEKREVKLEIMVGIAWIVLLVSSFVLIAFLEFLTGRNA